jgi:hypothetical protein
VIPVQAMTKEMLFKEIGIQNIYTRRNVPKINKKLTKKKNKKIDKFIKNAGGVIMDINTEHYFDFLIGISKI